MNTQEAIKQYLTTELLTEHTNLSLDDNLLIDGLVDSLGVMRLISYIERCFNIRVPPEDVTIGNFRSIRVIAEYTESRLATGVTT